MACLRRRTTRGPGRLPWILLEHLEQINNILVLSVVSRQIQAELEVTTGYLMWLLRWPRHLAGEDVVEVAVVERDITVLWRRGFVQRRAGQHWIADRDVIEASHQEKLDTVAFDSVGSRSPHGW